MPFNEAIKLVSATYLEERSRALEENNKIKWANHCGDLEEAFKSEDENSEWEGLTKDVVSINKVIGVRTKIDWLASCRRDINEYLFSKPAVTMAVNKLKYVMYNVIACKEYTDLRNEELK
jgi:hypothetical protein